VSERILLRRSRTIVGSDATYLVDDGLEVDGSQNYEVIRRRVFFDDAQLVTLHRERGAVFLILNGVGGGMFLAFAIFIVSLSFEAWPAALFPFVIGIVPFFAFLIRLAMGRDVVTVFGRRSKAVIRFNSFQATRARMVYGQVCSAIRRAQATPSVPESFAPPLPPDVPLPPP
jgi:hypothetical protein